MASKHLIKLPSELVDRCRKFGEAVVGSYQRGESERSRSVSMLDFENNPEGQAHAKMGECAFCLWSDTPIEDLSWRAKTDLGWDVVRRSIRFDVKTAMKMVYKLLIWPAEKTKIYAKKNFNLLVMVRGETPEFEIVGWTDKETFWQDHFTAVSWEEDKLVPGTWYMRDRDLSDPERLMAIIRGDDERMPEPPPPWNAPLTPEKIASAGRAIELERRGDVGAVFRHISG